MSKRLLVRMLGGVVGVWALSWLLLSLFVPDAASRGQFGDQFGAVNALFSGLAFAVILCALQFQHQDMIQQEKRFIHESEAQKQQFQKQVELAALSSYADLTLALWQHNEKNRSEEQDRGRQQFWAESAKTRYEEMMKVRQAFEQMLQDRGVIGKS